GARLRGRGNRAPPHTAGPDRRPGDRAHEARAKTPAQAREHPSLTREVVPEIEQQAVGDGRLRRVEVHRAGGEDLRAARRDVVRHLPAATRAEDIRQLREHYGVAW